MTAGGEIVNFDPSSQLPKRSFIRIFSWHFEDPFSLHSKTSRLINLLSSFHKPRPRASRLFSCVAFSFHIQPKPLLHWVQSWGKAEGRRKEYPSTTSSSSSSSAVLLFHQSERRLKWKKLGKIYIINHNKASEWRKTRRCRSNVLSMWEKVWDVNNVEMLANIWLHTPTNPTSGVRFIYFFPSYLFAKMSNNKTSNNKCYIYLYKLCKYP